MQSSNKEPMYGLVRLPPQTMIGENRQLVTDEPVEFEVPVHIMLEGRASVHRNDSWMVVHRKCIHT